VVHLDLASVNYVGGRSDATVVFLALDVIDLSPDVIADTLGAVLKYQDDIQKLQDSEAKRILDEVKAETQAA
jgi:hypothetical protein